MGEDSFCDMSRSGMVGATCASTGPANLEACWYIAAGAAALSVSPPSPALHPPAHLR